MATTGDVELARRVEAELRQQGLTRTVRDLGVLRQVAGLRGRNARYVPWGHARGHGVASRPAVPTTQAAHDRTDAAGPAACCPALAVGVADALAAALRAGDAEQAARHLAAFEQASRTHPRHGRQGPWQRRRRGGVVVTGAAAAPGLDARWPRRPPRGRSSWPSRQPGPAATRCHAGPGRWPRCCTAGPGSSGRVGGQRGRPGLRGRQAYHGRL
jgi:hypothetical protein